jgi:hypothetical protein
MGTTWSICCRDHTKIAHISAGTGFWTYVDWDVFAHLSEYYTPLKPVTLFLTPCIMQLSQNCRYNLKERVLYRFHLLDDILIQATCS